MIRKCLIALVAATLFAESGFAADKYQWQPVDSENGCRVYTSTVPGKEYIAAKASCILPAGIGTVGEVLRDIVDYPKWMEGCKEIKMLKVYDPGNDGFIFWYRQSILFNTDRDMVLKSSIKLDSKNGKDTICTELTKEIPYDAGKGYIRMPSFISVWMLEWVDREHTIVTFMIDPDLGDGLPKSVANAMIKSMPCKSLKKMVQMVESPHYREAGKTSR